MSESLTPDQLYQQAMTLLNISQATMNESTVTEAYQVLKQAADQGHAKAVYSLSLIHILPSLPCVF